MLERFGELGNGVCFLIVHLLMVTFRQQLQEGLEQIKKLWNIPSLALTLIMILDEGPKAW